MDWVWIALVALQMQMHYCQYCSRHRRAVLVLLVLLVLPNSLVFS
jgi:hypothetical protein